MFLKHNMSGSCVQCGCHGLHGKQVFCVPCKKKHNAWKCKMYRERKKQAKAQEAHVDDLTARILKTGPTQWSQESHSDLLKRSNAIKILRKARLIHTTKESSRKTSSVTTRNVRKKPDGTEVITETKEENVKEVSTEAKEELARLLVKKVQVQEEYKTTIGKSPRAVLRENPILGHLGNNLVKAVAKYEKEFRASGLIPKDPEEMWDRVDEASEEGIVEAYVHAKCDWKYIHDFHTHARKFQKKVNDKYKKRALVWKTIDQAVAWDMSDAVQDKAIYMVKAKQKLEKVIWPEVDASYEFEKGYKIPCELEHRNQMKMWNVRRSFVMLRKFDKEHPKQAMTLMFPIEGKRAKRKLHEDMLGYTCVVGPSTAFYRDTTRLFPCGRKDYISMLEKEKEDALRVIERKIKQLSV